MDEENFGELYAATFADVWRFTRRRTDSATEADDVCADVYAVAWRRHEGVPTAEARLWLFGVARHVLANHLERCTKR